MKILGISAYYHDSAACLLINGQLIAAAQEERFSRKKNDSQFPSKASIHSNSALHIRKNVSDAGVVFNVQHDPTRMNEMQKCSRVSSSRATIASTI